MIHDRSRRLRLASRSVICVYCIHIGGWMNGKSRLFYLRCVPCLDATASLLVRAALSYASVACAAVVVVRYDFMSHVDNWVATYKFGRFIFSILSHHSVWLQRCRWWHRKCSVFTKWSTEMKCLFTVQFVAFLKSRRNYKTKVRLIKAFLQIEEEWNNKMLLLYKLQHLWLICH